MLASKLPWLSIAARGKPAVPLVKISAASAAGSTSAMSSGSAAMRSSKERSVSTLPGSVAMTLRTVAATAGSIAAHAAAAAGSTNATQVPIAAICCSISGAGLCRVERHHDRTKTEHCKVGLDEVQTVAAQQDNTITATDAEPGQPAAHPGNLVTELAVRGLDAAADDRNMVGRMAIDDVCEIHRPPIPQP